MKLDEGKLLIDKIANQSFGELIKDEEKFKDIIKNKGKAGQILESLIKLKLSNTLLDFEDGELKTNKCNDKGNPVETIAITQISSNIDKLILNEPFNESHLAKKIHNILYVGIIRDGDPHMWKFLSPIHIDFSDSKFSPIWKQLEEDYNLICGKIKNNIETNGSIHTINGKYIQIRTKDSSPYHPIFSHLYNRYISNKNYAFYFKKDFIKDIKKVVNK